LTIFAQALALILYASSGENLHPPPRPQNRLRQEKPIPVFWSGEGGQKTLGLGSSSKAVIAENGNSFITYLHLILTIPSSKTIPSPAKAFQGIGVCKYSK